MTTHSEFTRAKLAEDPLSKALEETDNLSAWLRLESLSIQAGRLSAHSRCMETASPQALSRMRDFEARARQAFTNAASHPLYPAAQYRPWTDAQRRVIPSPIEDRLLRFADIAYGRHSVCIRALPNLLGRLITDSLLEAALIQEFGL